MNEKQIKKNKEQKSFPVKVMGMRVDWFISSEEGKTFLNALLKSQNLDLFNIQSLQIIIEYLYAVYSYLQYRIMPVYVIQAIAFIILVFTNERYHEG